MTAILLSAVNARAAITLNPPEAFLTNIAQRILATMASDFAPVTNVNAIMVWPTNQYGNGLHRVIQQAANIYEATRSNEFPSVFRPVFGNLGTTNCYIVGWTNDNDASTLPAWMSQNTNAIPLVIAAKRGFPNFNEFTLRTDMLVERKLQLVRTAVGQRPYQTNQMYVLGLSNTFAVEAWNSYASAFTNPSTIEVTNTVTITITNAVGLLAQATHVFGTALDITNWSGTLSMPASFKLPLRTNAVVLSNSVYRFGNNVFAQTGTNSFEDSTQLATPFAVPIWIVSISNQLVYTHRIKTNLLDFVTLRDVSALDLTTNLATRALGPNTPLGNVWSTNRLFGPGGPTEGIRAQIDFSQTAGNTADWFAYSAFSGGANEQTLLIRNFRNFVNGSTNDTNLVLAIQTPFNPLARLIRAATWQANDPLVHFHREDLTPVGSSVFLAATNVVLTAVKWNETNLFSIGVASPTNINSSYAPWANEGSRTSTDPASLDYRLRDPGTLSSDYWRFPINASLSAEWLGRVHRGTPWQTIYLKSGGAARAEWVRYANQSQNHPTNDWRMAVMLASLFETNNVHAWLPINSPDRAAWASTFTGLTVLSNILDDDQVMDPLSALLPEAQRYETITIQPDAAQLPVLWSAIDSARAMFPRGLFPDLATFISLPTLSIDSPWLHTSDNQRERGITDHAYEMLPGQLLSRLRSDLVASAIHSGTNLFLELTGCEDCTYDLYSSPNAEDWARDSGPHSTSNGLLRLTVPASQPAQFYQFRELP